MQYLDIGDFEGTKPMSVTFNSKALFLDKIEIKMQYQDEQGNEYDQIMLYAVKVNGVPWYLKIYKFFVNVF